MEFLVSFDSYRFIYFPEMYTLIREYGIVFKARWFVRLDITRARPLFKWNDEGIARVISRKHNGHVGVYIGPYKPPRFKNNTFIIILKHFQK